MKKSYLKAIVDGFIFQTILELLIEYSISIYCDCFSVKDYFILFSGTVLSLIGFFFLIIYKQEEKKIYCITISVISSIVVFLLFLIWNIASPVRLLPLRKDLGIAGGLVILLFGGLYLFNTIVLKVILLIISYIIQQYINKKKTLEKLSQEE